MLQPNEVIIAQVKEGNLAQQDDDHAPELPLRLQLNSAVLAVRTLLHNAGLDEANYGSSYWNPLGDLIRKGDSVLIKPNWVNHQNHSGQGLSCLVTSTVVLEAILVYLVKASPSRIVVGDAPIQGCDFEKLIKQAGVERLHNYVDSKNVDFSVRDFRQTVLPGGRIENQQIETKRSTDDYVLFDLQDISALDPITGEVPQFRVTMYNPDVLQKTHQKGQHQYLVAREAIEADVVINVPKLKTHEKAGVTGALKNVVGIIGAKSFLAHHQKGGALRGGDAYPGGSQLRSWAEHLLDIANRSENTYVRYSSSRLARLLDVLNNVLSDKEHVPLGSWHGNDTVWRMTLDLQRILHYGHVDGTLRPQQQRTVITITDAIVAGQGRGPLFPTPAPMGILTLGLDVACVEWVHALLMGFDPALIPLVNEAFNPHSYAISRHTPTDIVVRDSSTLSRQELLNKYMYRFEPPPGWRGHCELPKLQGS